jgi:hypothetical protein
MTDDHPARDDAHAPQVQLDADDRTGTIEVTVGGDPFTAFVYDHETQPLPTPVLHPIRAPSGDPVTRGYPLAPRPGERVDHPHQVGHWLNHYDVNGVNFWANSGPDTLERWEPLGSIRLRAIEGIESGPGHGELSFDADWVGPDGPLLRESTRFRFRASDDRRVIDRITTLTAVDCSVTVADEKDGTFAVRVASALEHPPDEPITVIADSEAGTTREVSPTAVAGATDDDSGGEAIDATRRTGEYLSSTGVRGRDVWGTRAEWMRLAGEVGDGRVSVTVFDHPANVGSPTHWMARGYGLFAANPFGRADYSDGEKRLDFELDAGASTTLRYRIAVDEGVPDPAELDDRAEAFAERYPADRAERD